MARDCRDLAAVRAALDRARGDERRCKRDALAALDAWREALRRRALLADLAADLDTSADLREVRAFGWVA